MSKRSMINFAADSATTLRYYQLGNEPPDFDLTANDDAYRDRGAHTIDRHGPDIPLRRDPRTKTIEGRIYGDLPWAASVTRSYQWLDLSTINREVDAYVRLNWETIRADLALGHLHKGDYDAGYRIGRGYFNSGMYGTGPRRARYGETTRFNVLIRLAPGLVTATPFILSAYPWG
ncbi:hypothetical protein AB0M36_25410 [Actinoplanes sp. NPDC051346]|uniref:hypothetical protein n=1 Tax=Actinoplanes sp. NPDC051346 TaxID=3155048 RepID=UPI00343E7FEE